MLANQLLRLLVAACLIVAGVAQDSLDDHIAASWALLDADDTDDGVNVDTMKKLCKDSYALLMPGTADDVVDQQCQPDAVDGIFQAMSKGEPRLTGDVYSAFVKNFFASQAAAPPPPAPADLPPPVPPMLQESAPVVEQASPVAEAPTE